MDGDIPRLAYYCVYISQLIGFARVCNHVADLDARNFYSRAIGIINIRKTFSKFYRRHYT